MIFLFYREPGTGRANYQSEEGKIVVRLFTSITVSLEEDVWNIKLKILPRAITAVVCTTALSGSITAAIATNISISVRHAHWQERTASTALLRSNIQLKEVKSRP